MKSIQRFLNAVFCIGSGMVASSLLVTGSENWKVWLPISMIVLSFKIMVIDPEVKS